MFLAGANPNVKHPMSGFQSQALNGAQLRLALKKLKPIVAPAD
jgi:hypothetical protein